MTDSGLFVKILEVRRKRLPKDVSLPCITGPYSEDYCFGLYGGPYGKIVPSQVIDLLKDKQEGAVDFQGATWKKYPNTGISKLKILTIKYQFPFIAGPSIPAGPPNSLEALAQYLRESNTPIVVLLKNENNLCCWTDGKIISASEIMPDKSLYHDLSKFVNDLGGAATAYLTQDTHFYEKIIETRDEVINFLDDYFTKLSSDARLKNISFIGDLLPVLFDMDKPDEAKFDKEIKYLQKCASEKNIKNVNTSIKVFNRDTYDADDFLVHFEIPKTDCKLSLSYEAHTLRRDGCRTLNVILDCSHHTYDDGASERPEPISFSLGTVKYQKIG